MQLSSYPGPPTIIQGHTQMIITSKLHFWFSTFLPIQIKLQIMTGEKKAKVKMSSNVYVLIRPRVFYEQP